VAAVLASNGDVSGIWTGGASGGSSCTSAADGWCSVAVNNLKSSAASVTMSF
jgi:hypothetical protein